MSFLIKKEKVCLSKWKVSRGQKRVRCTGVWANRFPGRRKWKGCKRIIKIISHLYVSHSLEKYFPGINETRERFAVTHTEDAKLIFTELYV